MIHKGKVTHVRKPRPNLCTNKKLCSLVAYRVSLKLLVATWTRPLIEEGNEYENDGQSGTLKPLIYLSI